MATPQYHKIDDLRYIEPITFLTKITYRLSALQSGTRRDNHCCVLVFKKGIKAACYKKPDVSKILRRVCGQLREIKGYAARHKREMIGGYRAHFSRQINFKPLI